MNKYLKQSGFTLIEAMIVVGIVGILAAIAYPSYMSAVQKSNRAEATVGLSEVSQQLQRCFTSYSRFNDDTNCTVYKLLATGDKKITTSNGKGYYDITLSNAPAVTAVTYTLIATPVKAPQTKDKDCKSLSLDQAGKKAAKDFNGDDSKDKCW